MAWIGVSLEEQAFDTLDRSGLVRVGADQRYFMASLPEAIVQEPRV
jgi:hypothetical protein